MLHHYNLTAVGVDQLNRCTTVNGRMLSIGCSPRQGRVGGWWEITQLSRELPLVALGPIRGAERVCRSVSWLVGIEQMRKSRNRFKSQNRGTNEEVSKSFQNRFDFETI